jgi:inorganic triphosphatase YgiF
MTLQDCKDKVAYRMRLTWEEVVKHHSVKGMETTMGEVAELYASQFQKAAQYWEDAHARTEEQLRNEIARLNSEVINLCVNVSHNSQIIKDGHCHLCKSDTLKSEMENSMK